MLTPIQKSMLIVLYLLTLVGCSTAPKVSSVIIKGGNWNVFQDEDTRLERFERHRPTPRIRTRSEIRQVAWGICGMGNCESVDIAIGGEAYACVSLETSKAKVPIEILEEDEQKIVDAVFKHGPKLGRLYSIGGWDGTQRFLYFRTDERGYYCWFDNYNPDDYRHIEQSITDALTRAKITGKAREVESCESTFGG